MMRPRLRSPMIDKWLEPAMGSLIWWYNGPVALRTMNGRIHYIARLPEVIVTRVVDFAPVDLANRKYGIPLLFKPMFFSTSLQWTILPQSLMTS
jgi:hypothetical protein